MLTVLTLVSAADACNRRGVVYFTGEIRGSMESWSAMKQRLVDGNDLDVMFDVWSSTPEKHAALKTLFAPCEWYDEPYGDSWKERVMRMDPRFQKVNGNLYTIGARETPHVVDMCYRLHHANSLLEKYNHSVVVRARLDQHFRSDVIIPHTVESHAVYADLKWGPIAYDAGEAEPLCPKMMDDRFAYGDYWGMRAYNDVYPNMFRILNNMREDPGFRLWWESGNLRNPGTFLSNAESFVAWRLRLANVRCHQLAVAPCLVRGPQNFVACS